MMVDKMLRKVSRWLQEVVVYAVLVPKSNLFCLTVLLDMSGNPANDVLAFIHVLASPFPVLSFSYI